MAHAAAEAEAEAEQPASLSAPSTRPAHPGPPYDLLPLPLLHLLSLHPLAAVQESVLPLLTDVLHNYLLLICRISSQFAHHAGRTSLTPWDISSCLDQVGPVEDLQDLTEWLKGEERNEWADRVEDGFGTAASGSRAREDWENRKSTLRQAMRAGRATNGIQRKMHWMPVIDSELSLYQGLQVLEEARPLISSCNGMPKRPSSNPASPKRRRVSRGDDVENNGGGDDVSETVSGSEEAEFEYDDISISTGRTSASPPPPLIPAEDELYKTRSLTSQGGKDVVIVSYVPSYLPPFPDQDSHNTRIPEESVKLENEESIQSRLVNDTYSTEEMRGPQTASPLVPLEENTSGPSSSASYFTSPIPYASSSLPQAGDSSVSAEDSLPSLPSKKRSRRPVSSSRPAFVDAYTSLCTSGEVPALLPQTVHRRQMALQLCQPSLYAPTDTLYGGISARPSAIPFTPNASHLITLPANGGAPRFTPTRPKGRPLELASSSGISNPILGYRKPAHTMSTLAKALLAGAPVVTIPRPETMMTTSVPTTTTTTTITTPGGAVAEAGAGAGSSSSQMNPTDLDATITSLNPEGLYTPPLSVLHRSLHIMDPPPMRDEGYVERVFRGAPLNLGGASSSSSGGGAAAAAAAGGGGGEEGSSNRGDSWLKAPMDAVEVSSGEKVKNGTLVYTWDWVTRDWAREGAI